MVSLGIHVQNIGINQIGYGINLRMLIELKKVRIIG